jgi:hypothetical protein
VRFNSPQDREGFVSLSTRLWPEAVAHIDDIASRLEISRSFVGRLALTCYREESSVYLGIEVPPSLEDVREKYEAALNPKISALPMVSVSAERSDWRWLNQVGRAAGLITWPDKVNESVVVRNVVAYAVPDLAELTTDGLCELVDLYQVRADGRSVARSIN